MLRNPDFAKVAEAIGLRGIRVERPDDVDAAVQEALAHDGSGAARRRHQPRRGGDPAVADPRAGLGLRDREDQGVPRQRRADAAAGPVARLARLDGCAPRTSTCCTPADARASPRTAPSPWSRSTAPRPAPPTPTAAGSGSCPTDGGPAPTPHQRPSATTPRPSAPTAAGSPSCVGGGGTPPQLHVTGIDGGEPLCLTDHPARRGRAGVEPRRRPAGVQPPACRRPAATAPRTTTGEKRRRPTPRPPRLVTEPAYRRDDLGYTRDRRTHVFVLAVPPADGAPAPTARPAAVAAPADRRRPRRPGPGLEPRRHHASPSSPRATTTRETDLRSAVHLVAARAPSRGRRGRAGGRHRRRPRASTGARWLPDGRLVVAAAEVGPDGRDFVGRAGRAVGHRAHRPSATGRGRPARAHRGPDELDVDAGAGGLVVVGRPGGGPATSTAAAYGCVALDPRRRSPSPRCVLEGHLVVAAHAATADGARWSSPPPTPSAPATWPSCATAALRWLTDVTAGAARRTACGPLRRARGRLRRRLPGPRLGRPARPASATARARTRCC